MSGDMMQKGFVIQLTPPGFHSSVYSGRKISVHLTPTGVRYYMVTTNPRWSPSAGKEDIRDISTQYRFFNTISGLEHQGKIEFARARLVEHSKKFYPESCIPDDLSNPFAWAAFPMLGAAMKQQDTLRPPFSVNLQVATGLRAFSVRDMIFQIFGESPRQLQAAASQSMMRNYLDTINVDNLTLASMLRGYLPPNEMAEILKMPLGNQGLIQQIDKHSANAVRLLFRRFKPQRIMRLIQSLPEDGDMLLRDAGMQYAMVRRSHPEVVMDLNRQFKSIRELHEVITREYRKLKNPDLEIPYDNDFLTLLNEIVLPDGANLVWPKTTHELIAWGDAMNNCIYSYGKDAVEGSCLLLGIVDACGEMTHNIMVRNQTVVQCYGKANARCTNEVLIKAVFDELMDADIIGPENDHTIWTGDRRVLHW